VIALLLAAGIAGGHVYAAQFEARGAHVVVWRYAAAGKRHGPPVVLFGELGFDRRIFDPGLATVLQARGREVFVADWRGTGRSSAGPALLGGLESLIEGDARAALSAALSESEARCAQLVGVGLGGIAAWLLADRACAVAALNVPVRYEVPNEAVRRVLAAVRAQPAAPEEFLALRGWLEMPFGRKDLFSLLLGLGPGAALRSATGRVAPQLARDVAAFMEGDALAARVAAAADGLRVPLLVVTAPRDNFVHPEHALAVRAPHDTIVLSRIEGFDEDHAHLPLPALLLPQVAQWLEEHQ
jgi:alpha-beta hydrolase superfamily lysophospholipase